MKERLLTKKEQSDIIEIARQATRINQELDFNKCYVITLSYYLTQLSGYDINYIPPEYEPSVKLLYKNPYSSYIHYRNNILYSKDMYAKTIKEAEIMVLGDDPRCPW